MHGLAGGLSTGPGAGEYVDSCAASARPAGSSSSRYEVPVRLTAGQRMAELAARQQMLAETRVLNKQAACCDPERPLQSQRQETLLARANACSATVNVQSSTEIANSRIILASNPVDLSCGTLRGQSVKRTTIEYGYFLSICGGFVGFSADIVEHRKYNTVRAFEFLCEAEA